MRAKTFGDGLSRRKIRHRARRVSIIRLRRGRNRQGRPDGRELNRWQARGAHANIQPPDRTVAHGNGVKRERHVKQTINDLNGLGGCLAYGQTIARRVEKLQGEIVSAGNGQFVGIVLVGARQT